MDRVRTKESIFPINVTKLARVTGASHEGETLPNPNRTHERYQIYGTDLGIMWEKGDGEVFIALGDTYGEMWKGSGAGPETADWRCNVLAVSSKDNNPEEGLIISRMIEDEPGHAKELLNAKRVRDGEWTVIPTAGVTVGTIHYMHYMSIYRWGSNGNGRWLTNHAGIAYSEDHGETWVKSDKAKWNNDRDNWDNVFQQAAFVKEDGYVYMFSTPCGRHGDIYVSKVNENELLNIDNHLYWNGDEWTSNLKEIKPVAAGPAGELSVMYHSYFDRWIMVYLSLKHYGLVIRDLKTLTGPWSEEKILVKRDEYPGVYGGFIHPTFNDRPEIYFNLTQWDPYNVFWMKATLSIV